MTTQSKHKFPYKWYLKDGYPAKGITKHSKKVFGTFICGGGSSMGYKLAGYEHLGGVEIDPKVSDIYKANHNPKYLYTEDLREFNKRTDLPKELYELDLLDGSPPCSTFSMAGDREKAWGKSKKFREGQANQVLDDLVFEYIDTIEKLKPKVCLLENVKGIITGNAKWYSKQIVERLTAIGYRVQVFLLNAATMGVPQRRERVFFIGLRNDIKKPKLKLSFNEELITFGEYKQSDPDITDRDSYKELWAKCRQGYSFSTVHPKGNYFGEYKCSDSKVPCTIIANQSGSFVWHSTEQRVLNKEEICQTGTYPIDFDFDNMLPKYLIGMSVPPVMTAQISNEIYKQWLK